MKKTLLSTIFLGFLLISCNYDADDKLIVDEDNQETEDYQFLSPEGIVYYTGLSDCTGSGDYNFDGNRVLEDLLIPDNLPQTYDLSQYLPPIGDQGQQGSCVHWATTYYLKSFQERIESGLSYNDSRIMSPAYTYNQVTQGICEGTALTSALSILTVKGTTSIASFPYFDNTCNLQPTQTQDLEAEANKISDYKYLSGQNMVSEMKALIIEQTPILIAAFLSSEFGKTDELGLTAYRDHAVDFSQEGGCHAMLVTGYSDTYNAFKVVNSWGEDWGENGFIWIDYAAFDNVLDDTAEFRVINSAIVAYDL
ncbi:C1 family peptidase [Psychroserpens sp.]|uniref:C1 family peptidase n=1 Tax=Psychroserpens sp. TaxID=2020870 RepID=UPI002B2775F3|nr:C1 family peptidase [Psychroserpens sp.]